MYDYGTWDLSEDTRPLRFVKNYLDTYRDVFGLQSPDVNTAVGISRAIAINLSDAMWQKYKIGERYKIVDPATKQPSVRNIFLSDGDIERQGDAGARARCSGSATSRSASCRSSSRRRPGHRSPTSAPICSRA